MLNLFRGAEEVGDSFLFAILNRVCTSTSHSSAPLIRAQYFPFPFHPELGRKRHFSTIPAAGLWWTCLHFGPFYNILSLLHGEIDANIYCDDTRQDLTRQQSYLRLLS